ncbi:helix-turn-helix transcriptional regulator [Demequina globuliformis]|uniref:helix-turn-helix transcriptional regulator n=1 Tax=Demequina globuliformis TaxID=676202 RepID=UPI000783960E|nr:WYL domain-containing protein [Demequina globuliformis]
MAADRAVSRVTRLLGIVEYLETHGATPFSELAAHFGVTVTQIEADLFLLWVSGQPGYSHGDLVDFDGSAFEQQIADVTNAQGLRQVSYSPREAAALMGALAALVATGAAPDAAQSALAKLTAAVGSVGVEVVDVPEVNAVIKDALDTSISARNAVEITYVDAQQRRTVRVVEPHRLVAIDGAGYLECYCLRADDYRTLRLDRIESARAADVMVTHPPASTLGFSLHSSFTATVRITRAGRWAVEDLPNAQLEIDGDEVVAHFPVADQEWIAGRLLAIAPHLRSVTPESLRAAVEARAEDVLAAHAV